MKLAIRSLSCLCLLVAAAVGQTNARSLRSIDDDDLAAMVQRLVPVIERACGRKFEHPPVARLADAGDVMRVMRAELAPYVDRFFEGQPKARIQRALQLRADVIGSSLLGKYAFAEREVLALPHLVSVNLDLLQQEQADGEAVFTLILAHELVHALQDQELAIGERFRRDLTAAEWDAMVMAIEGHAVFCSERVAAELGIAAAVGPSRAIFCGCPDCDAPPAVSFELRRRRGYGYLSYLRGAAWVAAVHGRGGDDAVWQQLAEAPPRVVEMLADGGGKRAAATRGADSARRDRSDCLVGVEQQLASRSWTWGRGELSELMVLGESWPSWRELQSVMIEFRGGGEWFGTAASPLVWRAVYALAFADDAAAQAFVEIAERVALRDATEVRGKASSVVPGPTIAAGSSRSIGYPGSMRHAAARLVWFRRGPHVVQVTLTNAPLADEVLAAVATSVLDNLER